MEPGKHQTMISVPGEKRPEKKEHNRRKPSRGEHKKRFALQEQAPVQAFLPGGINSIQYRPHVKSIQWEARESYMRKPIVIITCGIAGNPCGRLGKILWVLQFLSCQRITLGIPHHRSIRWIDHDPSARHEHLGNHLFGAAVWT